VKILFNDIIQYSGADPALKSPALANRYAYGGTFAVSFDKERPVDAIGIGNSDASVFEITFNEGTVFTFAFKGSGLYPMPKRINAESFTLQTDADFIGRLAAGIGVEICTSVSKEPGFNSTAEPRVTLSGQVIEGRGGYTYRSLSLDSRYRITREAIDEIAAGYKFIGMGYPFFINLEKEAYKLPYDKLYAEEKNQRQMRFEGGVFSYRYSRRWEFTERF
jgi:hypothetical protein